MLPLELDALGREALGVVISWLSIAAGATAVAVLVRLAFRGLRAFPPQRLRATPWTGSLVAAAFLVFILARDLVLPYVDRDALARLLSAGELTEKSGRLLAYCAADSLALPLQLAAWAGLLVLAGRPFVIGGDARRIAAAYLAGFRTWLVLTPLVYAVSLAAELVYRLVTGRPPEGHPIIQTFEAGPVPAGVYVLLLVQAVVVAPIKEEVFFRGILQPFFSTKPWGGRLGLLLAALVGLAVHGASVGAATDFRSTLSVLAPGLFVLTAFPIYVWLGRRPPMRWLPVGNPILRSQAAASIVGTSLLFANFHANVWPTPIPLFVLALGLGWLAFRTQSVVAPIVVHALFNAIVFATLALQPIL